MRELYELPKDDLQMLSAELLDARRVLDNGWALLESTNYVNWLTVRFQSVSAEMSKIALQQETGQVFPVPDHAILAENHRLLESTARFAEGLRQNLSQPSLNQGHELVTPWQLNPDAVFAKADNLSQNGGSNDTKPRGETTTVIIWAKLADPQLANLLDRCVIGKPKKIDRKLIGKLNTSMKELFRIVEDTGQQFADVKIEPFGVPVDVYHAQTSPFPVQKTGLAIMFSVLALLFAAGLGHVRLYLAVLISVICSFGTYLGFCAPWFEMVTPFMLFVGVSVLLFGFCAGVLQAATFLNVRHKGHSVSGAIVEMMQISGKSILNGGLMTVVVFLAGVFYLWFFPVEPTTATLSFRSSLVGINLTLFLLAQSVLACLIGQLAILPALIQITQLNRRILTSPWQKLIETRNVITPQQTLPMIPIPAVVLLTFALFAGFLYCVSRPDAMTNQEEKYFITTSEKQAAEMPILVSRQGGMQSEFEDIPGLFACDASRLVVGNDANRRAMIDNMSHMAVQTSVQQKIPLPNQQALYRALVELYNRLGHQFSGMQKITAPDKKKSEPLQKDLLLCQKAGEDLAGICQLLKQLPEKEFYERVDAWQEAVASDLVIQQRRLQNRLHHANRPEMEIPSTIAKRFLDADRNPIVWIFPVDNRQTGASREYPQPIIDLFPARETGQKMESGHVSPKHGGFPLLVREGRQLMYGQLPVVGAVTLVVLLLLIVIVHQSVQTGATTVLAIVGGVSLYGLILSVLGIPFGKITLYPVVFFPMVLPVFLDLFRHSSMSPDRFNANIGGTLICLGVGIVVAGHLMLYADPSLMTAGRVMTIGWASLMVPLVVNLVSVASGEWRAANGESQEYAPHSTPQTPNSNLCAPQPAGLTTRDQLDFYRERIEATGVFEQQQHVQDEQEESLLEAVTDDDELQVANDGNSDDTHGAGEENDGKWRDENDETQEDTPHTENHSTFHAPHSTLTSSPKFPPVWSVGTHRRNTQRIVTELAHETFSDQEKVVSLAANGAQIVARKSKTITVTATSSQATQDESPTSDAESPTILPMRQHDETTKQSPTTSRRRFG
jgi:hypothetical protein